jgi:hypothetical protein
MVRRGPSIPLPNRIFSRIFPVKHSFSSRPISKNCLRSLVLFFSRDIVIQLKSKSQPQGERVARQSRICGSGALLRFASRPSCEFNRRYFTTVIDTISLSPPCLPPPESDRSNMARVTACGTRASTSPSAVTSAAPRVPSSCASAVGRVPSPSSQTTASTTS